MAILCLDRHFESCVANLGGRVVARAVAMGVPPARPKHLLGVVSGNGFLDGSKTFPRRQCVLNSGRALSHRIEPALSFTHEVAELLIDRFLAPGQLEALVSPGLRLRRLCPIESFDLLRSQDRKILSRFQPRIRRRSCSLSEILMRRIEKIASEVCYSR